MGLLDLVVDGYAMLNNEWAIGTDLGFTLAVAAGFSQLFSP
jgi:hypothetical protein